MQTKKQYKGVTVGLAVARFLVLLFGAIFIMSAEDNEVLLSQQASRVSDVHLPSVEYLPPEPVVQEEEPPVVKKTSSSSPYPIHTSIVTTVFWVGEAATADNAFVANDDSAWDTSWVEHFGGWDDPDNRKGWYPASFTPQENPFYVALPYGDYTASGVKDNVERIYWYEPFSSGTSLLKNRWVKITRNGKTVYGQWEDVGPFESDDVDYVFGEVHSKEAVGLDVSPAIRDYLGFGGKTTVSWQFVDQAQVPAGPWKQIVTTSGPSW